MKIARKTLVLAAGLFLTISAFGYFFWYKPTFNKPSKYYAFTYTLNEAEDKKEILLRLNKKSTQASDYINEQGFDGDHCL
mgnify:FL=1